jgi:hypothetical protein
MDGMFPAYLSLLMLTPVGFHNNKNLLLGRKYPADPPAEVFNELFCGLFGLCFHDHCFLD